MATGKLHRVHRGVYAIGHPVLSAEGRWMAAVLACGAGAVLSHRSAAALWGLRRGGGTDIDVTILRGHGHARKRISAHRVRSLDAADVTSVRGIPCTTVPRTLLDLAGVIDRQRLERALGQAEVLGIFDRNGLEDVLERASGRRGSRKMRAILDEYKAGTSLTESELEERFLDLCVDAGIRRPRVNEWLVLDEGAAKVDFLWPEQALIVETDGRSVHSSRRAFEHDRQRDQRLVLAGYRIVRFTWKQITRQPQEVATTVSMLLERQVRRARVRGS